MPSINIYTSRGRAPALEQLLPQLRDFTAKTLSCGDRTLATNEMSLRIIIPEYSSQIADTEIEMFAYQYSERVKKQDEICRSVRNYVQQQCPQAGSVYAWLALSELGHSAE